MDAVERIALCQYEHKTVIMEVLIAPEKRGQGRGSALLNELLNNEEIIGFTIRNCEAVIYPSNIVSQKTFENAGFVYRNNYKDENGDSFYYIYESKF